MKIEGKIVKGIIREGKKQYGSSHSGFIGKKVLERLSNKKIVSIRTFSTISYLNFILKDDWSQDAIESDISINTIKDFYAKFNPLSTFDSMYIFNKRTSKITFFGDDTITVNDILMFFRNNRGKGKVLIVFIGSKRLIVLDKIGDRSSLKIKDLIKKKPKPTKKEIEHNKLTKITMKNIKNIKLTKEESVWLQEFRKKELIKKQEENKKRVKELNLMTKQQLYDYFERRKHIVNVKYSGKTKQQCIKLIIENFR